MTAETLSRRAVLVALGLITTVGALLRAATVTTQSLWFDELVTASLLREGFVDMIRSIPESERTPYLYYVLAWPTTRLLGDGELGLRAVSVAAGTLTIPAAYLAARELASRRVGVVTAGLVAVNPMLVWYAQETRAYALLALLSTVGLWLFARALRRAETAAIAGWAVVAGLAIATHYLAVLLLVPELVVLASRPRLRRRVLGWATVPLLVLLAHLPLLAGQAGRSAGPISDASLPVRLAGTLKAIVVGFGAPLELVVALVGAALTCAAIALALRRAGGREREGGLLGGGLAAAALALALLLALLGRDYLLARNLIAIVVPLVVLLAAGIATSRAGRSVGAGLAVLSLLVVLGPVVDDVYGRTDWRGAAAAVGAPAVPRAVVVTPPMTPGYWLPYLDGISEVESPVSVEEIVVVGLANEGGFSDSAIDPPPPGQPSPPPGFAVSAVERRPTFTIVRYRAPRPTRVTPQELADLRLDPGTFRVLLQAPVS